MDVPVVDITATVAGLRMHADRAIGQAAAARELALSFDRTARYLTDLADTLEGMTDGYTRG